ncbi:flagellin domain-containing protein [Comamonas sp. NoAH]|uniref:flagellin domain-containing protein n=1 Tax=Comamonas halotolerans TaxID=3041496 RepID=UPI0024E13B95|nr:flagellin domain-containing protein [Comamonas sp. NoAH]
MALTINTNLQSLNAQRNLAGSQGAQATAMQRLSSGLRVNSAKDDAAGLAIAERMNAQVRGMNVAVRNANDGISLAQTAEGALGKVGDNLQRMRELAVQSANGTNSITDQQALQKEFAQLSAEITRVAASTNFNGKSLLNNADAITFQVGAGTTAGVDTIDVNGVDVTGLTSLTDKIGDDAGAALTANADVLKVIENIDKDLTTINSARAELGAVQNRFEAVVSNLQIASENASASRGRIMDADFAQETANLSRAQVLQQAGMAMVAQANQLPQNVLSLLR